MAGVTTDVIDLRSDTVTRPTAAMRQAMATAEVGDDQSAKIRRSPRSSSRAAELVGKEAAVLRRQRHDGQPRLRPEPLRPRRRARPRRRVPHLLVRERRRRRARRDSVQPAADHPVRPARPRRCRRRDPPDSGRHIHEPARSASRTPTIAVAARFCRWTTCADLAAGLCTSTAPQSIWMALGSSTRPPPSASLLLRSPPTSIPSSSVFRRGWRLQSARSWLARPNSSRRARRNRKIVGGAMRQAGVIAAAGLVALNEMIDRLPDDHRRAKRLAQALAETPGVVIDLDTIQSNIVIFRPPSGLSHEAVIAAIPGQRH